MSEFPPESATQQPISSSVIEASLNILESESFKQSEQEIQEHFNKFEPEEPKSIEEHIFDESEIHIQTETQIKCHICRITEKLYKCATCSNLICNVCLSDEDPTNCNLCSKAEHLNFDRKPLQEDIFDTKTDTVKTIMHKGTMFVPIGTAMMTNCAKISQLSDESLDEMLAQYSVFVKEAEESYDKRKVLESMAKNEKECRSKKKYKTGTSLAELGINLHTLGQPRQASVQPSQPKSAKNPLSNISDLAALAAQLKAAGLTSEMLMKLAGAKQK